MSTAHVCIDLRYSPHTHTPVFSGVSIYSEGPLELTLQYHKHLVAEVFSVEAPTYQEARDKALQQIREFKCHHWMLPFVEPSLDQEDESCELLEGVMEEVDRILWRASTTKQVRHVMKMTSPHLLSGAPQEILVAEAKSDKDFATAWRGMRDGSPGYIYAEGRDTLHACIFASQLKALHKAGHLKLVFKLRNSDPAKLIGFLQEQPKAYVMAHHTEFDDRRFHAYGLVVPAEKMGRSERTRQVSGFWEALGVPQKRSDSRKALAVVDSHYGL